MRLLVITNDFPPTVGGIENYIFSLVRRWPPEDVLVVTRTVPGSGEFDATLPFEVIREPGGLLLPTPALFMRLRRIVTERRVQAIHFPSSLPLGILGRALGAPYAVSVHGGEFLLAARLPGVRSVLAGVCSAASVIFPESSFSEALVKRVVGEQVCVQRVTCGVDPERYTGKAAPAGVQAQGPVVVSVSRLIPRKGPAMLVRALPRVHRDHPETRVLIVGGGPSAQPLQRLAARLGVGRHVTFAGSQPWEKIPSFLAAGDMFALPTRERFFGTETEGLPLAFVEAAAAGLPLIGGDSGGVADAVRPGQTGILVDGRYMHQTAEAILRLIDEPETARRFGQAARAMVLKEFTWDLIFQKYRLSLEERCARTSGTHR